MKKICPHRTPPSSSYSHSAQKTPAINLNELARRIGMLSPQPQASSQPPSFISQLPPEILSEIFLYCIPHEQFPVPCRTQAPLLLTQVSASWRALALVNPDLWTAIHINYKDPAEDIPATDLWLSRSGNKPLILSIAVDFGEQPHQEIIDAICRHSKRWRHVRFDFRHLLCPAMYSLNLAQDQIPELCTFEFHARDISNTNVVPITRLLHSAPKLREITWVDDLADTDTLLELPLGRLTRLSLEMDHGTLDYLQVLNQCSNLEHIRITRPSATTPQTRPPLFLPKLTSLNISSDLTGICDHLVLPALKEVRIYAESDKQAPSHPLSHDPEPSQSHPGSAHAHLPSQPSSSSSMGDWEPIAFLSLIDRSACAISSLSVTPPITERTLLTCLRRVSKSLVKLSIDGVGVGDALIAALTHQATEYGMGVDGIHGAGISESHGGGDVDMLCPALQEISLDTRVACAQGRLAAMIESRLVHSSPRFNGRQETWKPIRRVRVVDGQRDLEKLRDLEARSRQQADNSLRTRAALTVDVIPKKPNRAHTRNFFFRRKLCASR